MPLTFRESKMAKEEIKSEPKITEKNSVLGFSFEAGFKFGLGMFTAFLSGCAILTAVAVGFYYLSKLF